MKTTKFKIILSFLIMCVSVNSISAQMESIIAARQVFQPVFGQIIDSAEVTGSILVYDPHSGIIYSNNFKHAEQGFLPASTFKIPNSIIALETGIMVSEQSVIKWDGKKRRLPAWEKDLSFREAFHVSCVPCYQEIARKVGAGRMIQFLEKFQYGEMVVDSTSIDLFWLEGESKISQIQQIEFLNRFYNSRLPISEKTTTIMKKLMVFDENA